MSYGEDDWLDYSDLELASGSINSLSDEPDEERLEKKAKFPMGFALPKEPEIPKKKSRRKVPKSK